MGVAVREVACFARVVQPATIGPHSRLLRITPGVRDQANAWLDRPLGRGPTFALVACLCALPAWLMRDALRTFILRGDDFAYLAESRSFGRLLGSLFVPHNAHVVPLFRLWTFLLATAAGRLEHLPTVLMVASYVPLLGLMIAAGVFAAREARSQALGLAAMLLLGSTTVMEPATTWYAAGQALWSALGVLLTLLALQGWRDRGGRWRLVLAALAAVASAAFWSGGYAAGVVGAIYLWIDGNKAQRRAIAVPLIAALLAAAGAFLAAGMPALSRAVESSEMPSVYARPFIGLLHTCQAIPEALLLNNLGLDATTTRVQGVVLTLALLLLWLLHANRTARWFTPLEGAGAAIVVCSFLLVFTFRAYLPYSSLRGLAWYHAMPQAGAVLWAVGWWARCRAGERAANLPGGLTRGGALAVALLAAVLLVLQSPRAARLFEGDAGATRGRAEALSLARARREAQRSILARLDEAEQIARREGIGRTSIARTFGRIVCPGLPREVESLDAADLLDLPSQGTENDTARVRQALGRLLAPAGADADRSRPPGL